MSNLDLSSHMALCKLCSTIPFDDLPPFPNPRGYIRVADHVDMPELLYLDSSREDRGEPFFPKDPVGFPYHEDLDALANSAATCPLCFVVQAGALQWKELYNNALQSKFFVEFTKHREPIPDGQKLWLTKRPNNTDGFVVLVRNPTRKEYGINLLTGVSFGVKADSPLASRFPLRPVEADSGSSTCLDTVKSWLEDCVENHAETTQQERLSPGVLSTGDEKLGEKDPSLPPRVLEIGLDGKIIRLADGAGLSGRYACLSYCWGSSRAFTSTRESIMALKLGFALSELPQTVLDAILISRHLGLRYLWVDSLCICQDDLDDWAQQSAFMNIIYSKAHVVIAANHAADKSVGCFHSRVQRPTVLIQYPGLGDVYAQMLFPSHEWNSVSFKSEPLSQRGWALQERILGRRIIHYNTRQVFFECDHGIIGEDGCGNDSRFCGIKGLDAHSPSDYHLWNSILWTYGLRKLSKQTDKLPAMSGLASIFEKRFQAQYVAGLWSHRLISGLAWQGLRGKKSSSEYTGPSWSWAGFDGIAAGNVASDDYWIEVAKVEDWHMELKEKANPYGEVKDAWLRIYAPITKLFPVKRGLDDEEIRLNRVGLEPPPRFYTKYSSEEGSRVILNYDDDKKSREWHKWEIHVLLLQQSEDRDKASGVIYGLVVRRVKVSEEYQFKQIGWMYLRGHEAVRLRDDRESWMTVKLV